MKETEPSKQNINITKISDDIKNLTSQTFPNPAEFCIPKHICQLNSSTAVCNNSRYNTLPQVLPVGYMETRLNPTDGCGVNPNGGSCGIPVVNSKISLNVS